MNIIKRAVRKFGFDIVRFKEQGDTYHKGLHSSKEGTARKPAISREKASEALKSVGREPGIPPFTYFTRPRVSSPQMEEIENLWWNKYGRLIEKVWVLSESTNKLYRSDYVAKAAQFFRQPGKKAKILDLGCGSGWFGRLIADKDLYYYGTDYSSTQIDIANVEKEKAANKEFLNYLCIGDIKKVENLNEITGVVIHAFLHHLYWDELDNLFKELVSVLPQGCRFFIVEPIYADLPARANDLNAVQKSFGPVVWSYRSLLENIRQELTGKGLYDSETEMELEDLVSESKANNFFFSPKEVSFRIGEFTDFIKKYLKIESRFHCGVLDLETAQLIDKIRSNEDRMRYSTLLFPLVEALDKFLIDSGYFESTPETYLFTAFECTLVK